MITVQGNKTQEISTEQLLINASKYSQVILDIGTGDGRFVYKSAKSNPTSYVIGIDPSQKQLEIYSKKCVKEHLENTLFILGSAESLLENINNFASEIYVYLPWGTLLMHIATPTDWFLQRLNDLLKPKGTLTIVFGYSSQTEPKETERLMLDNLNEKYIKEKLAPKYEARGFTVVEITTLSRETLKHHETTWSKKLSFGNTRPLYCFKLSKS